MPTAEEIRTTISNSSAVHFAAGTVDLAAEKLRGLPARVDQLREEAPERIQSFREKDLPRLRAQAQTLAQQGAETAKEYATKARETYDELAERGRAPVAEWSGRFAPEGSDASRTEVIVERLELSDEEDAAEGADADPASSDTADDRTPGSGAA